MKKSTANITTLVAVGGTLVSLPAAALELGDIQVRSHLGQPLRASVAFALAPNEELSNTCVSVQGGQVQGKVPGIGETSVSVANGVISIIGKTALREPLVTMRLNVRCPYAAQISRDYTMLVDPAGLADAAFARQTVLPAAAPAPAAAATAATVSSARRSSSAEPVLEGARYRVQPGESLSEIAQRIQNRPVGLWPAVNAIFAANPDAFLDNDPNKLQAGSWLTIPSFGAATPSRIAAVAPAETVAAQPSVVEPATGSDSSVYTGTTPEQAAVPVDPKEFVPEELQVPEPVETPATRVIDRVVDIPDVELPAPETTAATPNVATARIQREAVPESDTNWLAWLGGAGLALIALLLFFGRLVRQRFGSSPIGEAVPRERRQPDSSRSLDVVSEMEVTISDLDETQENPALDDVADIEVAVSELDATQDNLALDADLIIGSGLQEGNEVDVAQDFGFAATTQLDHEFPEEMISTTAEDEGQTDVIPPLNIEAQSILESEVLPEDPRGEDDDYDMSVILDATKMPDPEDVTLKDLEAIPVETENESLVTADYTVSSEVDYTVLEQDYQDELSATQALNEEIARAAAELNKSMDAGDSNISQASIAALDVTAQLPANNDEEYGDDDVGEDDITAKFPAKRGA